MRWLKSNYSRALATAPIEQRPGLPGCFGPRDLDPLRETFDPPKSRFVKTREVAIAVHTTGKRDDDPVFIEVAGGRASEIAEVVEEAKAREV